jgi:ABC-type glutathione transport system ATPase component
VTSESRVCPSHETGKELWHNHCYSVGMNMMPRPLDTSTSVAIGKPVIALEGVSITYGRGANAVQALSPTTLKISEGDFVALVGPSGCGKSTILKLVSNLIKATTGHVFVGGREVGAQSVGIGMAFQNPTMLPWLTIRDNIMLPLKIVEPYRTERLRRQIPLAAFRWHAATFQPLPGSHP